VILHLSVEQAAALEKELTAIIDGDRYFLSPRIQMLREIRNMIRPNRSANRTPSRSVTSRRASTGEGGGGANGSKSRHEFVEEQNGSQ
jgi:hypothetical protein